VPDESVIASEQDVERHSLDSPVHSFESEMSPRLRPARNRFGGAIAGAYGRPVAELASSVCSEDIVRITTGWWRVLAAVTDEDRRLL
jgi:hypothetical protein